MTGHEDERVGKPPPTVDSMIRDPRMLARRIEAMAAQRFVADSLLPPGPPPTRRQRLVRRVHRFRERLAARIAPWAVHDDC